VQCLKIRLKPNKKEAVRAWCKKFYDLEGVDGALRKETVIVESLFLDEQPDADYLIFYLRAESLQQANDFLMEVQHPVNDASNAFMNECWDLPHLKQLEVLYDVDRVGALRG